MVYEAAPAKINLTPDALFKRNDDYHEISMIMTTVDLSNRLSFQKRDDSKIVVDIEHNYVTNNHKDLAYQAAELMMGAYQLKQGVTISIDKGIPVSVGLARGSADTATTIRGINRLYELDTSLETLSQLGLQIGTDVPFCIYNETTIYEGRGGKVKFLDRPPSAWVILVKPNLGISSPDVFEELSLKDDHDVHTEMCEEAIGQGDYMRSCKSLSNRLEAVSMSMHPEVRKIKNGMLRCSADGALMSGSGPTVYAFAQKENQAKKVYDAVNGCCNEVYLVRLLE